MRSTAALILGLFTAATAGAQQLTLDWYVMTPAGGLFEGNELTIEYTGGELFTGPVIGNEIEIEVGYWAFILTTPCDVDGDGAFQLSDLAVILGNFGLPATSRSEGDLNADGVVDLTDLSMLLAQFGQTCN